MSLLAIESSIVERLRAALAGTLGGVHIYTAASVAGVEERSQKTPSVHLIFDGYTVLDTRTDGRTARIEQSWAACIATRNARSADTGAAARQDAGVIAQAVADALMGWKPEGSSKFLKLTGTARPTLGDGVVYLPMGFSTELVWGKPAIPN